MGEPQPQNPNKKASLLVVQCKLALSSCSLETGNFYDPNNSHFFVFCLTNKSITLGKIRWAMLFYIVFAKLTNFAKFENNRQSY